MNTYFKLFILFLAMSLISCEDVIDVDVQTAPSRLVIEASLDWEKGTTGSNQTIKISKSTPYFDTATNTSVTNASVRVVNDNNNAEFIFTHQGNGAYTTTEFIPIINQSYTLEVIHEGETYRANETLKSVVDITEINQSIEDGNEDDELEVNIIFTDPEAEENYYLFKFQRQGDLLPTLEDGDDEFVNGNEITWWYEKEEDEDTDKIEAFRPGDVVDISFFGISEAYSDYIGILIEQSEGAGLFSTTPVPLRGNCINTTTPDNYAFGYFRLTQVVKTSYTFQ
ncbi:DUF4249 domain-containing protein [Flavivirga spongiicola]|uniref:DUF4249 domain-containing protein n=1 Tax=Flavivirga spongiicola TaxID=421621 RepID=A0ABU7XYW6_9FLAO|nr:DUF4249 domain-containing protein [Flavivirga sp. MEBiC05379]MDO5980982.1 DUF4249 domain-containing protein [Flavivirga sp. MEBiC05379]